MKLNQIFAGEHLYVMMLRVIMAAYRVQDSDAIIAERDSHLYRDPRSLPGRAVSRSRSELAKLNVT